MPSGTSSENSLNANFHEKAHFVKADVAAPVSSVTTPCPSRYASIRTVSESTLLGDSVHYEIHLFGLPRRRCNLRIGLSSRKVDQVRNLRTRLI
jgi:hypothetical protein